MITVGYKSHAAVAALVCGLHVAAFISFGNFQRPPVERPTAKDSDHSRTVAYVMRVENEVDVVPLPEVRLAPVGYRAVQLTQVRFEDAQQGDISGIVAAASAPRLTETCARVCDATQFAMGLGLTPGQAVTAVLVVEVLPDGTTGAIEIRRSSGKSPIDAAAIQFARTLKWIPGTKDQKRISMRVAFPVTMAATRVQAG